MAANVTHDQLVEEDYIDLNLSSSTNLLCCSETSSPAHSNEFEFQKNAELTEKFPTTSPADDLFHNGKLLPLHLPPPIQPSQKLLDSATGTSKSIFFDSFHLPSTTATPFESCSISPSTSCYASQELNPEDYFNQSQSNKSWSKKIKLLRHPSFPQKLKASTAYLKSLFAVSTCSNDTFAVLKAKDSSFVQRKQTRRSTFGFMKSFRGDKMADALEQRRSFSADTVKKFSSSSSSSSTSSSSSNSSIKPIGVKYVNSEVENLIQGAIAYCKNSQQSVCGKTTVSDDGFCSFSASGVTEICEKQEINP